MDSGTKGDVTTDEGKVITGTDATGTDVLGGGYSSSTSSGGSDVSDKGVTNNLTGTGNMGETTGSGETERRTNS
jgi:hypothetical protein